MAYCTFGLAFGWTPLFTMPPDVQNALTFTNPWQLFSYLVLAIFMAILAMLYTRSFYWLTHLFRRLPILPHFKPAIGAGLSGLLGVGLYYVCREEIHALAVLSFGYGVLQDALIAPTAAESSLFFAFVLMVVALGKIVTTGLTIGSGGSGGVFGPSMVIGGCGGGALGIALNHLWPGLAPHPATFVIVGMAGFFAAAAKTPFSTLIMVGELTGNYNLLLPTLWVCALAFLLSDEQSIYSSQVETRSLSPAHQGNYVREVLAGLSVAQFLTPPLATSTIRPGDRLATVAERLSATPYQALPVTDSDGRLLGVVSLEELLVASQSPHLRDLIVAADMVRSVTPLKLDDRLDRAMELFAESGLLALPVIEAGPGGKVLGVVQRSDVSSTYLRYVHGVPSSVDAAG